MCRVRSVSIQLQCSSPAEVTVERSLAIHSRSKETAPGFELMVRNHTRAALFHSRVLIRMETIVYCHHAKSRIQKRGMNTANLKVQN
jgi:hypothetical protein